MEQTEKLVEIIAVDEKEEKWRCEDGDLWNNSKCTNIHIIWSQREKEREP